MFEITSFVWTLSTIYNVRNTILIFDILTTVKYELKNFPYTLCSKHFLYYRRGQSGPALSFRYRRTKKPFNGLNEIFTN